jgi:hypothetical protein
MTLLQKGLFHRQDAKNFNGLSRPVDIKLGGLGAFAVQF